MLAGQRHYLFMSLAEELERGRRASLQEGEDGTKACVYSLPLQVASKKRDNTTFSPYQLELGALNV